MLKGLLRAALFLLLPLSLLAHSLSDYLDLFTSYPETLGPKGSWQMGEIEIALDPREIEEIETIAKERLLKKGVAPDEAKVWSQVGIVAEDQYLYWIRDAVTFPLGLKGTYDRIIWKSNLNGPAGVAIFGILENGKVILNLNYRHATRSWEIELPRGMREKGEKIEATVKRELKEETGGEAKALTFLGIMAPDTGILTGAIPIYSAQVSHIKLRDQEYSEAIYTNITLSPADLKAALFRGYLEINRNGRSIKAAVRDPFLTFALSQLAFFKN